MRLIRDVKAVSKLILVLAILITFVVGALFSYVYTMGLYAPSEFRLPEKSVIAIQNVEFYDQDTSFFNVTVLNPSYSPSSVDITRIEARTPDDNRIHVITDTQPIIPHTLKRGELQTFKARWNWANYTDIPLPYTDQPIEIRVFLQDGRGEIFEAVRPLTPISITDLSFDPSTSVHHFNVTVQNLALETYVNITAINIEGEAVKRELVAPILPYTLNPGGTPKQFQCFYNWTRFLSQNATVRISTLQGYIAESTETLPKRVTWGIQQIIFNSAISTQQFNITVTSAANSSTYLDVSRITVSVNQGAPSNISAWSAYLSPRLETNSSMVIVCTLDWTSFKGSAAKVTIYTSQGFTASREELIPQS